MTGCRGAKGWAKLLAIAGAAFLTGSLLGSIQNKTLQQNSGNGNPSIQGGIKQVDTDSAGSIQIVGSTSMEKITGVLAECFMEKYPDVIVTIQFAGSSAGIRAAAEGSADIGISSRNLNAEEKASGAVENIVALDGIAVCVDNENKIGGLTKQQLIDIYTGRLTNWSALGGADVPVVVVGREAGSGTRCAFEELLGIKEQCTYANELDSTGAVMARVAATPGAIGYISFDVIKDTIKALPIEGAEPVMENIKTGSYFLYRPFVMVSRGEISDQNRLVQVWFDFVYSEEGKKLIEKTGFIPAEEWNPAD